MWMSLRSIYSDNLGIPDIPHDNVHSGNGYEDEGNAQALVETIDLTVQLEGKEEAKGEANDVVCDNVEQETWRHEKRWAVFMKRKSRTQLAIQRDWQYGTETRPR